MKQTSLAVAIGLALSVPLELQANPSGPKVVHGTATFSNPSANVLNVTNSNNAIINWQSFNIGRGQTTNFLQPSASSSVLNKVVGNNPSQILGNLNSNGKVFLINQHGILVGQGAQINTAGFFGSTLNLTNEDYLNGDLKFEGGGLGGIDNQGYIHAGDNGHIVLIAPDIENGGVIEVDDGNVILAAGKSITITSLENASIQFEVNGSDDTVTNLGQVIANNGAANLFAGTLEHSGAIRATGLVQDADGTIRLVATDSNTVSGSVDVSGQNGGRIEVLGDVVSLESGAYVDASGDESAGEILIGGDQQGLNPDIMNATSATVAEGAEVHADGKTTGNGGRVIVFAENDVHVHGEITARGGSQSGDGGFIETSGLQQLDISTVPDAAAPFGEAGEWLIDPYDITIVPGTGVNDPADYTTPFTSAADGTVLGINLISLALSGGTSVEVTTGTGGGTGLGDITLSATGAALFTIQSNSATDVTLTLNAQNDILVDVNDSGTIDILGTGAGALNVVFNADSDADGNGSVQFSTGTVQTFPITIDTNGGTFTTSSDVLVSGLGSDVTINADWTIPQLTTLTVDQNLIINSPDTVIQNYGEIVIGSTFASDLVSLNLSGDTLDLLPGSMLSGFGTLTGNVDVNGGTVTGGAGISVGAGVSPGSLLIQGDFTMNSGLLYALISSEGSLLPGLIEIDSDFGGTARINGGTAMMAWANEQALNDGLTSFSNGSVTLLSCYSISVGGPCVDVTSPGFNTWIGPLTSLSGTSDSTISGDFVTFNYELDTSANVVTWTGADGDGVWSNGNNWNSGEIPTAANNDYVFIHDAVGSQQIVLDALETAVGVQSFENIQLISGTSDGILRVNGDIFILDDAGSNDGLLSLLAPNSALEGTGVLYTGPGAGLIISQGNIGKDIVNWGGVVTTAGSSFTLNSNPVGLVNNSIFLVGEATGSSSISGTGSIVNNGVMLFGDGAILNLLENVSLSSASTNAMFQGVGTLSFQGSSVYNVAATPSIYDTSISIELNGGSISNAENMAVMPDLLQWHSGVISGMTGTLNIAAGQVMNLHGLGDMSLSGGIGLSNQGTISFLSSAGDFYLDGVFQNDADLIINHTSAAAALLIPVSGSATLNNGAGGTVSFDSVNDLDLAWDIDNLGNFWLNNGMVRFSGNMDIASSLLEVNNNAEFLVASGGQLTMGTSSDFGGDGSGLLSVDAGGFIDLDSSLTKNLDVFSALQLDGGVIDNIQNASLPSTVNLSSSATLTGSGSLMIPASTTVIAQSGSFSGQDSINVLAVTNQGTVDVLAGASLTLIDAELINGATGSITGGGQLIVPTSGILTASGGIDVAEIYLVGGVLNANTLTYGGSLNWSFGTVADTDSGSGLTTTGLVSLLSGTLTTDWTIDSVGSVLWTGTELDELIIQNATISNFGDFTIESFAYMGELLRLSDRSFSSSANATFVNHTGAELVIDANDDVVDFTNVSYVDQGGVIGLESGTFTLGSGNDLVLDSGGSLQGFGTFQGNVDNQNGKVSPGATGVSIPDAIGTLTITGNLSQGAGSALEINIDSTGADMMNIGGSLLAGGAVDFGAINGASDAQVQQVVASGFDPVSYSSISGEFSTVTLRGNYGFSYSSDGTLTVGAVSGPVSPENRIIQQIETLLESNQLDYAEFVDSMSNLGGDLFEALFANEIREDEDEKAPRLVCK